MIFCASFENSLWILEKTYIWICVEYNAILSTAVEKEETNGTLSNESTENKLNKILSSLLSESFLPNISITTAGIAFMISLIVPPSDSIGLYVI